MCFKSFQKKTIRMWCREWAIHEKDAEPFLHLDDKCDESDWKRIIEPHFFKNFYYFQQDKTSKNNG